MSAPSPDGDLMTVVYDELHRLARAYFRDQRPEHTLQPTALVHEAYVRLADRTRGSFDSRGHFLATAARAMRQVLVDHARRKRADRRGGGQQRVPLDPSQIGGGPGVDVLDLNDSLERLAALDERKARVVELRLFGGLTIDETAAVLGVSGVTVSTDWRMASAWLIGELKP